jgi:ureidoacrylate peracid hydrolase
MTGKPFDIAAAHASADEGIYPAAGGSGAQYMLAARPEPIALRADNTALIVVDMQNAGAVSALARIQVAIRAARMAGIPVVFFQNGWDPDYVEAGGAGSPNWYKSNALKTMRKRPELMGSLLAKGGWDYQLVDELVPQAGDIVLSKPRYSGFYNTSLDSMLRARGIRNLVFTGIATNVCVESTLRDGFFLEYFGVVLEDATYQAGPAYLQQASLYNIETFFGWVSSVDEFCRCIADV